jgi:hypothetical protein
MPFVHRRAELDRIERLAASAAGGRPERHLALVGVRRRAATCGNWPAGARLR